MSVLVMGVLNVTPDSFSDGGRWLSHDAAISHGLRLIADGAHIVDIGGESTRPGAQLVDASEEIDRVLPVIEALSSKATISIDTVKPEVAIAAVKAGATVINDVSASLCEVAADLNAGWVAMHMQGNPQNMQQAPSYGDVISEIKEFLANRAQVALDAGIENLWIDPGIGFGKTLNHNLLLLKHLQAFTQLGFPVAIGTSRKSFLGTLLGDGAQPAPVDQRLVGSLATVAWAIAQGVQMVRVHDVKETVQLARVVTAIGEAA